MHGCRLRISTWISSRTPYGKQAARKAALWLGETALSRYEFMITFAPLPVEGGTGSPLNPLAIF